MKDPHETLGVAPGASEEEIKKAFHKLALECHPDRHPGDASAEERFKEINSAYRVLTGKERQPGSGPQPGGWDPMSDAFQSIFGDMFGRTHRQDVPQISLQITLEEAYFGTHKDVPLRLRQRCQACGGVGRVLKPNEKCKVCGGTGQVVQGRQGTMTILSTCGGCHGMGRELGDACGICSGHGIVEEGRPLSLDIPAGIQHGQVMEANEVFVTILHAQHPLYCAVPGTLHVASEVEVGVFDLMVGGEVEVRTLAGTKSVKIAEGLQPGTRLRIKGSGMRDTSGAYGDHVVQVKVKIPTSLSTKHKEMLRVLKQEVEATHENHD